MRPLLRALLIVIIGVPVGLLVVGAIVAMIETDTAPEMTTLLYSVLGLAFCMTLGGWCANLAETKGYRPLPAFWAGFFFGVLALFYCDPPYVGTEDSYSDGGAGFGEAEHRELARLLNGIAGQAAVSYFPCPLVNELYPAPRWRRSTTVRQVTMANDNRHCEPKVVTELLLMNYALPQQAKLELG